MKKIKFFIVLLALNVALVGFANAAVLTFEDLYTEQYQAIPNGYGGFNWNSATQIGVVNGKNIPGTGYYYGRVSGDMVAFNYYGDTPSYIDLVGAGTFDYVGAYWTSAWFNQQISFEGYNDGLLLYTSGPYSINTQTPQWIALNWTGIDRLVIHSTNKQWAMDNFTYNEQVPVPEPSTVLLLGFGLGGLAGLARKKFKR